MVLPNRRTKHFKTVQKLWISLCITNLSCQNAASQSAHTHTQNVEFNDSCSIKCFFSRAAHQSGANVPQFPKALLHFSAILGGEELIGSLRSLGFLLPKKKCPALSRRSSFPYPTVFRGQGTVRYVSDGALLGSIDHDLSRCANWKLGLLNVL